MVSRHAKAFWPILQQTTNHPCNTNGLLLYGLLLIL
jgi:hypothetical protein